MAALMVFIVSHGTIRLKVRLLKNELDVHREHQEKAKRHIGNGCVRAFFLPAQSLYRNVGTIVLPSSGRLAELIPHEVTHAVLHKVGGVHSSDDESVATAIGVLSARIARKIKSRFEVSYA